MLLVALGSLFALGGLVLFVEAISVYEHQYGLFSITGMVATIVAFWGAVASVIAWLCFHFSRRPRVERSDTHV